MDRHVAHFDLDTFFVSASRLLDNRLVGKPVLIGGSSDRGVVAACSYEARQFGVHSAMPMRLARQLCPEAIIVKGDYDLYSKKSAEVTSILMDYLPVVEKASIDEFYADMTGMDRFIGCLRYTRELRERVIKETGLPISFGLSINKVVSKVATGQAKPNGLIHVPDGTEKPFLAPLSVKKIPMVGDVTFKKLAEMGLNKVRLVQEIERELMFRTFGKNGLVIWDKCSGIDSTPVVPYSERKGISREQTFQKDTTDVQMLRGVIVTMITELGYDLRTQEKLTGCISIKIRYADFNTYSKQTKIIYTSSDRVLTQAALELFDKLFTRRQLVRLIGVSLSDLVTGNYQIDLFNDAVPQIKLHAALDSIRNRFGNDAVMKAVSVEYANKRP